MSSSEKTLCAIGGVNIIIGINLECSGTTTPNTPTLPPLPPPPPPPTPTTTPTPTPTIPT